MIAGTYFPGDSEGGKELRDIREERERERVA